MQTSQPMSRSRTTFIRAGLAILGVSLLTACAPTISNQQMYSEPGAQRSTMDIRRVAVVPNRLPLNLTNPERWREHNWEIIRDEFTQRGITVVDYRTSVAAFEASGLPVEDTPSSRDKFAMLAEELGVDAIIVPYYGTFASAGGSVISQSFSYDAVATFQIYHPSQNQFVSRIDASARQSYRTYSVLAALLSIVPAVSGNADDSTTEAIGLITIVAVVADLYQGLIPPERRWERAFRRGIRDGLTPLFLQMGMR